MQSDMNKILIFRKIQIWRLEQFTITQITSCARECSAPGPCGPLVSNDSAVGNGPRDPRPR